MYHDYIGYEIVSTFGNHILMAFEAFQSYY